MTNATWREAFERCQQYGARMCTRNELMAARFTGCGLDDQLVWTWEECAHGQPGEQHIAALGNNENIFGCREAFYRYGVRCCADEACGRRLTSSDVSTFAELRSVVSSADSGSSIPVVASMTFTQCIDIGTFIGTTYSATPITITGATCTEVLDGGGSTRFFWVYGTLNLECLTLQNGYRVSGLSLRAIRTSLSGARVPSWLRLAFCSML